MTMSPRVAPTKKIVGRTGRGGGEGQGRRDVLEGWRGEAWGTTKTGGPRGEALPHAGDPTIAGDSPRRGWGVGRVGASWAAPRANALAGK